MRNRKDLKGYGMKSSEADYYFFQEWTQEYESEIPDRRRGDERELDKLVSDVFQHLYAVYDPHKPDEEKRTTLARWFYYNAYVQPGISRGDENGAPVKVDDFLKDVLLHKGDIRRNRLAYLLGNVGVGKTSFVNWLITCKLHDLVTSEGIWFIRLDVEELKRGQSIERHEFVYYLALRILKLAEERPEIFLDHVLELDAVKKETMSLEYAENPGITSISTVLCRLAQGLCNSKGRRLVIVIDNLDYLCHLNDRGLFFDIESTGEMHILQRVSECITMFTHHRELGPLGANILLVTRQDSYRVLKDVMSASYVKSSVIEGFERYVLKDPGWEIALDARCKLLRKAAEIYQLPKGRKTTLEELPRAIENDIAKGRPKLIEHLVGLSNHGLRQLMDFFSNYGWITKGGEDLEARMLEHPPVGLLSFMLNNLCRFGQFPSGFPNIYLVNRLGEIAGAAEDMQHRHSYWLKRMILATIAQKKFRDVKDIVDLFCGSKGRGYDQSIIKLCLGSLTDSLCSNCITVERGLHPDRNRESLMILRLSLNARGKHCMREVFDRFSYLQLVVEDYLLPLPRCVEGFFSIERFHRLNYSYLVEGSNEYQARTIEMVRLKAEQILLFLTVLEKSLKWERKYFEGVFDHLDKRNVELPDISAIRKSIIEELRLLNSSLQNRVDLVAIGRRVSGLESEIDNQLMVAYSIAVGLGH